MYLTIRRLREDPVSVHVNDTPCDEVFAMYLMEQAEKLKPDGYRLLALLMQSLKKCMNLKGWELDREANFDNYTASYCGSRPATYVPLVGNYFIARFLPAKGPQLERKKAIDALLHFNEWLYAHKYSNLKLGLLGND